MPKKCVIIQISSVGLDANIVSALLDKEPHEILMQNGNCSWIWRSSGESDDESPMLGEAIEIFKHYEKLKLANPEINTQVSIVIGDITQIQGEENSRIIDRLRGYGDVWLDMPDGSILLNTE
jgi:hypothetical protein